MSIRIGVINCGVSNIGSVLHMYRRSGINPVPVSTAADISNVDRLILPGVGSYDAGIGRIKAQGLWDPLIQAVTVDRKPILGICLGMQLFGNESEEGSLKGFGWIPGKVYRLKQPAGSNLKVPHMGWNTVNLDSPHPLFEGLGSESRFYFVHSYCLDPSEKTSQIGTTVHGDSFLSACGKGHILGVQFHPEKSHRYGQRLLSNFARMSLT